MLYTKCIFHDAKNEDGWRISVMSRHTLNDGKTPDERITQKKYHLWMPELAPENVGKYKRREISFNEFKERYVEHLRTPKISKIVRDLAAMAMENDVTILCSEDLMIDPKCHRIFLAKECQRYQKGLKVEHI